MGSCNHQHPLQHDGTSQDQRFPGALEPGSAPIHELSLRDWMHFAWHFAGHLNYFPLHDHQNPAGNWQAFMKSESEIESFLEKAFRQDSDRIVQPHLALFLSFLKLLKYPQEQLNGFTRRHLDFYYERVLDLSRRPAVPDRVFVLFELAKNAAAEVVPQGALLEAGKDGQGRPRHYQVVNETVISLAKVSALKGIFYREGAGLRRAEKANSADGQGAEFTQPGQSWQAFGAPSWAKAKVGLALASPVLLLKEGSRTILVNLSLGRAEEDSLPAASALSKCLACSLTGEKGWIDVPAKLSIKEHVLSLVIELVPSVPPVTAYNRAVHKGKYTTADPVLRILIDTALQSAVDVYDSLRKLSLVKAEIQVNVSGAKELLLENDHGKLDPSKVFFPFGPTPGAGSHFYIGYPELFEKNWSTISLDLSWKDKPADLSAHYAAYLKKFIDQNSSDYQVTGEESVSERKIGGDDHFTVKLQYLQDNSWYPASGDVAGRELFSAPLELKPDAAGRPEQRKKTEHGFRRKEEAFSVSTRSGYLRITLEQSFLHEHFARLYTLAAIARINHPEYILPLQPWMPAASSLTLGYSASEVRDFDQEDPTAGAVSLFYEEPFGQHEAAVPLKKNLFTGHLTGGKAPALIPGFSPEGEFFVGLAQAKAYDTVNLLFQLAEGSENPLAPAFGKDQKIAWSVLVSNSWKTLTGDWILADGTANLLRSGIFRLIIPPGAAPETTRFAEDVIWIRACLPEGISHESVCRLISVDAQAAEAVFTGSESEGRLPAGTISNMTGKPALIKKINQPYASFGGKTAEDSRAFWLRVSERLRHKQRAVTIWDYERLVLQEFPAVYKLKCLSHSAPVDGKGKPAPSERSPGDVSLVVIPDIRLRTSFDPLKPRASQGLLEQISSFVSSLHSLHVRFHVMNPLYETVKLDFRVKFYDQFDPNTYLKRLNEDLIRYLSPWAFGDFSGMHFGGTLYKSVVIRFLETRPYVDFVSRVRMIRRLDENDKNTDDLQVISASSAGTILVSAPEHSIQLINKELVCYE